MKTNVSRSRGRLLTYALILTLAVSIMPMSSVLNAAIEDGEHTISDPVVKVTIQKKVLEAVITIVGDRFMVSKETIITDTEGQQVSIREMLVPCDAKITYKTEHGKRFAQRIAVTYIGRNSTWKWEADNPE